MINGIGRSKSIIIFLLFILSQCSKEKECLGFKTLTPPLHADEKFLYDPNERVVLLRGVNVPLNFKYEIRDFEIIKSFGFNFIRLPISWREAEPEEGKFNMNYIENYRNFIIEAGKRGIYSMLDVHQGAWCVSTESIPLWMCEDVADKFTDMDTILKETYRFWHSSFLQQKLVNFWKFLIQNFKDLDGLIGYDVLNEPFSPDGIIYGKFEKCCLFPFYKEIIKTIREIDSEKLIILEPCVLSNLLPSYTEPFPYPNLIYSPHAYFFHGYDENGELIIYHEETPEEVRKKYERYLKEAKKMKTPLLIGEYGGPQPQGGKYEFIDPWLEESLKIQDEMLLSSAYWNYHPEGAWSVIDKERRIKNYYFERLRRPYPRYTAGIPQSLSYRKKEGTMTYTFTQTDACEPTEIYIPKEMMETGVVKISTQSEWSYDENEETLRLTIKERTTEIITIEILPGK